MYIIADSLTIRRIANGDVDDGDNADSGDSHGRCGRKKRREDQPSPSRSQSTLQASHQASLGKERRAPRRACCFRYHAATSGGAPRCQASEARRTRFESREWRHAARLQLDDHNVAVVCRSLRACSSARLLVVAMSGLAILKTHNQLCHLSSCDESGSEMGPGWTLFRALVVGRESIHPDYGFAAPCRRRSSSSPSPNCTVDHILGC